MYDLAAPLHRCTDACSGCRPTVGLWNGGYDAKLLGLGEGAAVGDTTYDELDAHIGRLANEILTTT